MSALAYEPEKVIYIGFKEVMTSKRKNDLERFFRMRGLKSQLCYEIVSRYDYESIKERLYSILDENDDCVLDLTGGKELVLAAMGAVCESRNIPTLQFDIRRGTLIQISNCHRLPPPKSIDLSIEEYVTLNGGAVVTELSGRGALSLSNDFAEDIEKAWDIRKTSPFEWSNLIYALRTLENMGDGYRGISTEIDLRRPKEERDMISTFTETLSPFINAGFISIKKRNPNTLLLTHKNKLIYQMLLKVGNIFELYTYISATEILRRSNNPYSDIGIGVFMDWDGIIHSYNSAVHDTLNEVDIVLIKGSIPIFISCKSGDLKKEALYELDTVANKFGGEYAKKIIVATHISRNESTRDVILQRARDMHIEIISDADIIPKEEFIKLLAEKAR